MPSVDPARALLAIGELAERSGTSVSALRFYEHNGLISAQRTAGNQRRYRREVLRRIAFIRTAQRVGISLAEIRSALDSLPEGRTPTRADWVRISAGWKAELDARIDDLQRLRSELDDCIGCGCLSLTACALQNPGDELGAAGPGAVRWRGGGRGAGRGDGPPDGRPDGVAEGPVDGALDGPLDRSGGAGHPGLA